jgi:hypothetical protein
MLERRKIMDNTIMIWSELIPTILMGAFIVFVAIPFFYGIIMLFLPYSVQRAISNAMPWNRRKKK